MLFFYNAIDSPLYFFIIYLNLCVVSYRQIVKMYVLIKFIIKNSTSNLV